jgi:hypothetical protein
MPRASKRSGQLGEVTTTPLVPVASATNGPDDEPRRTKLQRKYTLEELYAMRQILLATLPSLSVNDHEGTICLMVEARLQTCLLNGTTPEELREAYSSGGLARFQGL